MNRPRQRSHQPGAARRAAAPGLALALALAASLPAQTPPPAASAEVIADLQRQVAELRQQVDLLKEGPPRDADADRLMKQEFPRSHGLTFAFYGESKYRFPQSGANSFDAHRYVLAPSYAIADWLVFNSELELEHGGIDAFDEERRRFGGELELEQFYADILLNEHFNVRSLGLDLVPVGRINKYHEPTVFYSTERPELYREIIPSTWQEPGVGVFGKIVEGLDYQLMVSTGLEDALATPGSAATEEAPAGFNVPGITAGGGFRDARPRLGGRTRNAPAYSGRLHYSGLPGLDASASFYVTKTKGYAGDSLLALGDVEALYRVPKTGLELRADFAYWHIGHPERLTANHNATTADDVGGAMYGWYLEAAYHFWPAAWRQGLGKEMDLVPFVRYTQVVTQGDLLPASQELDDGTANKEFLTAGLAYFLNPHFVVKADYRHNLRGTKASRVDAASQDYFQIGAGLAF